MSAEPGSENNSSGSPEPAKWGGVGAASADTAPAEPAEAKPAEAKPAEAKPADAMPAGAMPAGAGSGAVKPEPPATRAEPVAVHAAPVERPRPVRRDTGAQARRAVRKVLSLIASLIKLVGTVAAAILVIYIVFVVGHANPENKVTGFITEWGHRLNLGLDGLFRPPSPDLTVLVNYGIAALVWFLVCTLVARLLRKL